MSMASERCGFLENLLLLFLCVFEECRTHKRAVDMQRSFLITASSRKSSESQDVETFLRRRNINVISTALYVNYDSLLVLSLGAIN